MALDHSLKNKINALDEADRSLFVDAMQSTFQRLSTSRTSGIYFLFHARELVYIGQAIDVFQRVYNHSTDTTKTFSYFAYCRVPPSQLDAAESRFIGALWPTRYNRTYKTREPDVGIYRGIRSRIVAVDEGHHVIFDYYDHEHERPTKWTLETSTYDAACRLRSAKVSQIAYEQNQWSIDRQIARHQLSQSGSPASISLNELLPEVLCQQTN